MANLDQNMLGRVVGQQVQEECGTAMGFDFIAQHCRNRVHKTALHPCRSSHELALAVETSSIAGRKSNSHRLEGLTGMALCKMGRPTRRQCRGVSEHLLQELSPRLAC